MALISRAQWGARTATAAEPLDARQVVGLAFHWPAMKKPLSGVLAVSAALREWQAFHMDGKKWRDIAYQVAIDQAGNRYELRGLDGQSAANGDEDVNQRYGAVLLVLAPGEEPSPQMIREVKAVVADHRRLFHGSKLLVGHQQIRPEPTECPGPAVMRLLGEGAFEPGPSPSELLLEEIRSALTAARRARHRTEEPHRPKVRYQLDKAIAALRKARDLTTGD